MLNRQNATSFHSFSAKFQKKAFYTDAAHVALYFCPWPMTAGCWCRWQEHMNNSNPDQYFHKCNKKPWSKLASFIRLEWHLPL